MQLSTDTQVHQLFAVRAGIHAVREEHDDGLVRWVIPEEGAREARVTVARHRARLGRRAGAFLAQRQLVEAQAATVVVISERCRGEILYRFRLQQLFSFELAAIHEHLGNHR